MTNPAHHRARSGARPNPKPYPSAPLDIRGLHVALPFDVSLGASFTDWDESEPEQVEDLPATVSAFRTAVTEPLVERLSGTLSNDGGAR